MNGYLKNCEECGKQFTTNDKNKRFHNRSCSATANNRLRGNTKPMKLCLGVCGNKIQDKPNQDYCSASCRQETKYQEWVAGRWSPDTLEIPLWLRLRVIADGCSVCGWSEVNPFTGKCPVQVDHISGDASDHSYDNIQALCPNHHSLTNTYGALNKGSGRVHRRSERHKSRLVEPTISVV